MNSIILTEIDREEITNTSLDAMNELNDFDKKTMQLATVQNIHDLTAKLRECFQYICKTINGCESLPADLESQMIRKQMERAL